MMISDDEAYNGLYITMNTIFRSEIKTKTKTTDKYVAHTHTYTYTKNKI